MNQNTHECLWGQKIEGLMFIIEKQQRVLEKTLEAIKRLQERVSKLEEENAFKRNF